MPIIKSAKKALRASTRKRVFNLKRKDAMKSAIKDTKKLAADNKASEAKKSLSAAYQAIDKALKRGVIKKNTDARKKSRLSAQIKKAS
ncbi:MAG: 30S ribosomal protein S20 [Candidatus Vogelbacteria bacterium]|nr:30S ribosomal protein S20 [Candidatus Vogelbacteria bacterium]